LGGLTLSRENIKLRTEYKDILRFYGFDLSSIEEANITVNIKNSSISELSTIDIITPEIGTIINNNIPAVTTMSMDTITPITMLSSKSMEATTLPSTATNITQEIVTISTEVQTTSTLVINSPAIAQSTLTMQSADSLTVVTSGESVQPSANAESVMGLSLNQTLSTVSTTPMNSETNSSTVIITTLRDNQNSHVSSTIIDSDTVTIGAIVTSMDADTPTISSPTADSVAVTENMIMQSANSLTAVTSSESVEPLLFAGAENMASSPRTLLPTMNIGLISALSMDQTNTTMVDATGDQSNQNSEISSAIAVNNATKIVTNVIPNVNMTEISNTNVQIPDTNVTVIVPMNDSDSDASMGVNDEISIFAANILNSDSSAIADTNTKIQAPATTTINVILVNASAIDTFNITTPKTLIPTTLNSTNISISTSINTITDSQLTEILTMPDTIEVTTLRNLTTMPFTTTVNDIIKVTPIDNEEITITSSQRFNFTSGNIVRNLDNSAIANSMINSISNDQIVVHSTMNSTLMDIDQALMNQSIVSLNRKKRTAGTATTGLESDLNMMDDITIRTTNKLNKSNLYKRTIKSPHRYFSNYPGTFNY